MVEMSLFSSWNFISNLFYFFGFVFFEISANNHKHAHRTQFDILTMTTVVVCERACARMCDYNNKQKCRFSNNVLVCVVVSSSHHRRRNYAHTAFCSRFYVLVDYISQIVFQSKQKCNLWDFFGLLCVRMHCRRSQSIPPLHCTYPMSDERNGWPEQKWLGILVPCKITIELKW